MNVLTLIIVAVASFAVLWFFILGLKLINDDEVGILTKKMFGKKMPPSKKLVPTAGQIELLRQWIDQGARKN